MGGRALLDNAPVTAMASQSKPLDNGRPRLAAVLGPAGSGKTQWCLQRYAECEGAALLLVPSEPYAKRLRERLKQISPDVPAAKIMTFGKLLKSIADCAYITSVHRTCQRLTLARIVEAEVKPEGFFGRVREMAGFVDALGDSIRELKLSGISPELLEAAVGPAAQALDDPAFERKAGELAAIYAAYQQFLAAHDLCDEEDLPARAAERIRAGEDGSREWAEVPMVLVDGFYRLSRTWRDVLAAVASAGARVAVTLPYEHSRPLLFATPARTLESLEAEFEVSRVALDSPARPGSVELARLERGVFRPEPGTPAKIAEADPAIRIFDAPNPYTEVEMVVRALRREHEDRSIPYSRCAVIVRSAAEYGDLLRTVGEAYDVPIVVGQGRSLAEHPLVKTLLAFCAIVLHDWRRDDVIGFLKSSYTPANKIAADSLRLRASRRGLRQGRDGWRKLARDAEAGGEPLARILGALVECDGRLHGARGTAEEWARTLGECVERLEVGAAEDEEARAALALWTQTAGQVALAARLSGAGQVIFADFHRDLLGALRSTPFSPRGETEAAQVLEPYDAGQLDAQFVAVMGLTERVFPRRVNEDPFFRDEERDALRETAGLDLERQSDRADDERLLFYMAATAARERLVLTFPRSAEESGTLPSFYLYEARALFDHVPTVVRTLADVAPHPDECVCERDRLLAECARAEAGEDALSPEARDIYDSRERPRLPVLPDALRQVHAASRRYSITEIESYNRCPFQHLMKYGLKLRAASDGAGAADKGTLLHAVMRRAMRKRAETSPEDAADARKLESALSAELDACMRDRPIDATAYRKRMMQRALTDTLKELARREVRYAGLFGATPAYFELAFGQEPGAEADDEEISAEEQRDYDSASTPEPLTIPGLNGQPPIHLCGAIDRVDLLPDGRRALVLDYKLGSSTEWDRIKQGKSLQMPLYMMAVEQLWGKVGAAGCYESPRDRGRRRFYRKGEVDVRAFQPVAGVEDGKVAKPLSGEEYAEALSAAQQAVRQAVERIREGYVMATPGEHCRWCDYSDVCRMGRDGVHDGEAYTDDGPAAA
jgi:ATP-dependent helicase/nuclease subunit B